jgi:hypothetical protein
LNVSTLYFECLNFSTFQLCFINLIFSTFQLSISTFNVEETNSYTSLLEWSFFAVFTAGSVAAHCQVEGSFLFICEPNGKMWRTQEEKLGPREARRAYSPWNRLYLKLSISPAPSPPLSLSLSLNFSIPLSLSLSISLSLHMYVYLSFFQFLSLSLSLYQ